MAEQPKAGAPEHVSPSAISATPPLSPLPPKVLNNLLPIPEEVAQIIGAAELAVFTSVDTQQAAQLVMRSGAELLSPAQGVGDAGSDDAQLNRVATGQPAAVGVLESDSIIAGRWQRARPQGELPPGWVETVRFQAEWVCRPLQAQGLTAGLLARGTARARRVRD
jgi:hypothetical protein